MKTKKDFLENYSSSPELAKKVFNQMGLNWSEISATPYDFRDASAGVSGFMYYADTCKFANRNSYLINNALNEFENEIGEPLNKPTDDETQYLNWLAWFALEHVIDQVIGYMEE